MHVNKFRKQQREVSKSINNKISRKKCRQLENNQKKGKKAIEEGRAILDRFMNMNV